MSRINPMTNYPAEQASSWQEYSWLEALQILRIALEFITLDPRQWAVNHDVAVDLPSAWWMAWYVWRDMNDPSAG